MQSNFYSGCDFMMMEREAPEVGVEEELQILEPLLPTAEARQQTWLSFFSAMLPEVLQASPQTHQLQRLPGVGVDNIELYHARGVMLSTGNIWQLLILRAHFPDMEFNSPYEQYDIEYFEHEYADRYASNFLHVTFPGEDDAEYQDAFRRFLLVMASDLPAYNDTNAGDDLPTKIAKKIAFTYYTNLELNVTDIQEAITAQYGQPWNRGEFSLDDINTVFVSRIVHVPIDNGRMELRTLLPYEEIVQVAVNELKHPPLTLQCVLEWVAAV